MKLLTTIILLTCVTRPVFASIEDFAKKSFSLTTKFIKGTARQSGKAAYNLAKPVKRPEIVGLWRIEPSMLPPLNIRIDPKVILIDQKPRPYQFQPSRYMLDATLEFPQGQYIFKGRFVRKVADPSVIKIRGQVYRLEKRFGGTSQIKVGTFVGKRRIQVDDIDESEYDSEDEEEGEEEETIHSEYDEEEEYDDL